MNAARLATLIFALGACAAANEVPAQEWPTRPVRFVMPFDPGTSADGAARAIAERLSLKWRQPVIVENRPGAGTVIGTDTIAKSAPDGHTFGWVVTAHSINAVLRDGLPYDTARDFAGVTLVYQLKTVIAVAPDMPVSTVDDLVRWAKDHRSRAAYTSPGVGTGPHLLGELFKLRHGLDMQHVAYKNQGQAILDVAAGRVPVMFGTLPSALPLASSGKLKLLAVVSDAPVPGRPDLPILADLLPPQARIGWNGIVVPAATPRPIVAKLNADIIDAVRSAEVQALLTRMNVQTITSTPEEFDELVRADIARWRELIRRAGIRIEAGN